MGCPTLNELPPPPPGKTGWPWTEESPQLADTMPDPSAGSLRPCSGQAGQVASPWPRVSIVTPSYNQGQFIEESIRSVLLQGYANLEYIIIDGGSTDNSVEVIRKYEKWLADWVSEKDRGQAHAINKGFARATGQLLGWINSDDSLYPSSIYRVVIAFRDRPDVDFLYGDVDKVWGTGEVFSRYYGESLSYFEMLRTARVLIPQQGSMWRHTVIDRVGALNPQWHVLLDRDFFMRVCERCKVEYLPGVLAVSRFHHRSKSVLQKRQWLVELPRMYTELFERDNLSEGMLLLRNEAMSFVYLSCAAIAYGCGETLLTAAFAARAVMQYPRLLLRKNRIYEFLKRRAEGVVNQIGQLISSCISYGSR